MPDDGLAPEPPLYYLHIPRTGGTSIGAALDDRFPAHGIFPGQLLCQLAFFGPASLAQFQLFRGHFGVVLPERLEWRVRGFTVLRDPMELVLSMLAYVGEREWHPLTERVRTPGFGVSEFLRDPDCRVLAGNWQARWLAASPPPGDMAWAPIPSQAGIAEWKRSTSMVPLGLSDDGLLARATETLDRLDVVGVTERLSQTMDLVGRRMGWPPLPQPGRRNVSKTRLAASDLDPADLKLAAELNQVDAELHRLALRRLERAAAPTAARARLQAQPSSLPYELDWAEPMMGSGWHERAFNPLVGWYRWTGPDTRSVVELPVAGTGPAVVEVSIVAAVEPSLLESLELLVGGERVAHTMSIEGLATVVRATVELPAQAPLRVGLAVARTASLGAMGPDYDGSRSGALAVARIRVTRPPAAAPAMPPWPSGGSRLPFTKVCELEDFADPELAAVIREVCAYKLDAFAPDFPAGGEHRKDWEVAMAVRSLRELGAVRPGAEILGVAAGAEDTVFHLTNAGCRVFSTDRYLDPGPWGPLAPLAMLLEPADVAPAAFDVERLVVQHMDARRLRYPDETFDGVFSSGSIEHFGSLANVAAAAFEMGRVLKPGGVLALSTEYLVRGPGPGRGWSDRTFLFSVEDLRHWIVAASGLELVDDIEGGVSGPTLATTQNLGVALGGHTAVVGRALGRANPRSWTAWTFPHVALEQEGWVFGSVHLTLRKATSGTTADNSWARPTPDMTMAVAEANHAALGRLTGLAGAVAAAAAPTAAK